MITRLIFLLTLLSLSLASYSSVPPFIDKNTLEKICKFSECFPELKEKYLNSYLNKPHSKAFAVSYEVSKATNKFKISSFGVSYSAVNRNEAENEALKACRKHSKDCKLLFTNNTIVPITYNSLISSKVVEEINKIMRFVARLKLLKHILVISKQPKKEK